MFGKRTSVFAPFSGRSASLLAALGLSLILALVGCGGKKGGDAASSWKSIQKKGELVVGLCAEYPPFESRDEASKQVVGFDVDLAQALAKQMGVKVRIVDTAWEGLLGGIIKGDYDVLITAMSNQEASAENISVSDPYYDLAEIIVVPTSDTTTKTADDLKGKIVGVQANCSSEKTVDSLTGLRDIKRYNRNAEAFIDLRNKRCQAVVVGVAYAATELKKETGIRLVNHPVASNPLVIVAKAGSDALMQKINDALKAVKSNGEYDAAVAKWLSLDM